MAVVMLLGILPGAVALAATPEEEFQAAENTFRFQDYKASVALFRALLYPEIRLTNPDQLHKARELLGACHFFLHEEREMEDEFTALLVLNPTYKLDPFYYPSALIDRFENLRKRLADLRIITLDPAAQESRSPTCQRTEETVLKHSWWPQFMPFGVGQFQNRDWTKGVIFAASQTIALGTNIATYIVAENLRGNDGFYSASDASQARNLRIVQYTSLGVFVGLVAWGILDAALSFEPEQRSVKVLPCKPPPPPDPMSGGTWPESVGLCVTY